jgi:hypothetical protein
MADRLQTSELFVVLTAMNEKFRDVAYLYDD